MSTPRGIKPSDRENYLVAVYFKARRVDFLTAAVSRAYRDAQRGAHGISAFAQHPKRQTIPKLVRRMLNEAKQARTQAQFDAWHRRATYKIKAAFRAIGYQRFTVGLAQKWLNMALKYIFVLGEKRVSGFAHLFSFCHAPIDKFVIEEAAEDGFPKLPGKWSRLDDYAIYMNTQNWFRSHNKPPLAREFDLWLAHARREDGKSRSRA